ncbi:DUF3995 domain-containing protein [Deinococcus sp. QL22]|uniref:DUF3995 domain-containing protein n=1 Tax=Deinococcus sp. QL22 TaxID=2939437 RepID=UPI002016E52C|nr:DUF3995 domain-containing protein [Deinococcus sp. QL22]UQN06905.1 DUF3995 domain-containing protein [Deinococcus sp. QL22]
MSDKLPAPASMRFASVGAALMTGAISALHVYWAAGGRAGLSAALPQDTTGKPMFLPSTAATLVVAAGLAGMSGTALLSQSQSAARLRWPLRLIAGVFLVRAIGDGRSVGLTGQPSGTQFARFDAQLYTPLCLLLAALYGVLGLKRAT